MISAVGKNEVDIMKRIIIRLSMGLLIVISLTGNLFAQSNKEDESALTIRQQHIVPIAAYTANGDLIQLKTALNGGLDAGLTVNEIKEVIVHLYAYCGFPRSIRGLQTFMEVVDDRASQGITDKMGVEASLITNDLSKYERGKKNLEELLGRSITGPQTGYAAFAPVIEIFLKEHLFADIFDRDILTFADRELVTISVLSSIGGVEPMLRSHLAICLNLGYTPEQLTEFVRIIKSTVSKKAAKNAQSVIDEVIKSRES